MSRVLALDPGERRIGVAISDPLGIIASPHSVIDRKTSAEPVEVLVHKLCEEFDVETIVVGLPMSLSGTEGPSADAARRFGRTIAEQTGRDVIFVDERFSSAVAEEALLEAGMKREGRREVRDKIAAAVVLQSYLDAQQ